MSVQAVTWALDARRTGPMPAEARLVLVTLADYADPDGRHAWPKVKTLAARLGITPRSVKRSLSTLRELGLIGEGDQRLVSHLDGRYRPTVYDLAVNGVQTTTTGAAEPYREISTPEPGRGDGPVTPAPVRGDAGDRSGVTPASPYEPPVEPPFTHLSLLGDPSAREDSSDDHFPVSGGPVTEGTMDPAAVDDLIDATARAAHHAALCRAALRAGTA